MIIYYCKIKISLYISGNGGIREGNTNKTDFDFKAQSKRNITPKPNFSEIKATQQSGTTRQKVL